MPKITKHRYKGYEVTVSYLVSSAEFKISLPTELSGYAFGGVIKKGAQAEIEREFDKIVNLYIKEGAERTKCIVIHASDDARCEDEFARAKGKEGYLHLQYAIVYRVKINGEFCYKYDSGPVGIIDRESTFYCRDCVILEWTPEREAFLERTISAINEIAKNVTTFIGNDNLAVLVDAKKPMFLIENKT